MREDNSRFTEQVEKKNCKTCGKTIRTQDKLKTECRECVLKREVTF